MSIKDIQIFGAQGGENFVAFNGPDEQFVAEWAIGADGVIVFRPLMKSGQRYFLPIWKT